MDFSGGWRRIQLLLDQLHNNNTECGWLVDPLIILSLPTHVEVELGCCKANPKTKQNQDL